MRIDANTIAIVTGASSGIGRETAITLARSGATVVAAARRGQALLKLEREVGNSPGRIVPRETDVASRGDAERLIDETLERFSRVDLLICNAGIYERRPASASSVEDYERAMAVNFYGAVYPILRILPHMLARKRGHIVVVSTVDGKKSLPMDIAYASSKFAVNGFLDVLRQELRGSGVSTTTVCPGRVDTAMIARLRVPAISAKIPATAVADTIVRAVRRQRSEVIVPWFGPKMLIVLAALSASLGDLVVRLFHLQGEDIEG